MFSISDFLYQDKIKMPKLLLRWTVVLVSIILFLIIMNLIVHFNCYYKCQGITKDGDIKIYVPIEEVEGIINSNYMYINNEKYDYSIKEINEDVINNELGFYQEILIKIKQNDKTLINNRIVDIKFILKEQTIFTYIINFIKGE